MGEWEEDGWYDDFDFDQYHNSDSNRHGTYLYQHIEETDEEREKLIDKILEMDILLGKIKKLPGYRHYKPYYYFPYENKPLYDYTKKELEKILRNLKNRLLSIIWSFGYRPSRKPLFYLNLPKEFDKYPFKNPLYRLYHKWVAPIGILSEILPPFRTEVTLSEEDVECFYFTLTNMEYLSELATLRVQGMLEDGRIKEIDLVKMLRHCLSNPKIPPVERKAIQDELIRWELQNLSKYKTVEYEKLWNEYYRLMSDRRKDYEKQQQQLLADGLRRRKEMEELRLGKPVKRKERVGTSTATAKEICRRLSSKSRRKESNG